jgi:Cysteine rich repeat
VTFSSDTNYRAARRIFAITALGLGLTASSVHGQTLTQAQKDAMKSNCRSDYITNCMSVRPGGKEALQCLERNMAKLSPACQGAVKAALPKPPPPAAAKPPPPPPPAAATAPSPPAAPPPPAAAVAPPPPAAPPPPVATAPARPAAPPPPRVPPPAAATAPPPPAPPPAATIAPRPVAPRPVAHAPTAAQREALKRHCRRDFRRYCAGVQPGGPQALACLERNAARLRRACARAVAALGVAPPPAVASPPPPVFVVTPRRAREIPLRVRLGILRACERDRAAVCPLVRPGRGRVVVCLAAHMDALSPACRGILTGALR